jgi:DNA-binding GntR family transcriptional regulator
MTAVGSKGDPASRLDRRSLVDQTADTIRLAIITGQLKPGDPLSVQRVADSLGTSHIPIREALRRLEGESLIETRPNRWAVVAGVGVEELQDIYGLRRLIESHVGREASGRHDEESIRSVERALRDLERCQAGGDEFWSAHKNFHWAILEPGLTPWSRRVLALLWQSAERYQRLYADVPGSIDTAAEQHRHLFELVQSGTPRQVGATIDEHLASTERATIAAFLQHDET